MAEQEQGRDDAGPAPASYGLELKALSLRELGRLSRWVCLPIFLIIKLLGISTRKQFGLIYPVALRRLRVDELAADMRAQIEAAAERWSALGFGEPLLLRLGTTGCHELTCAIAIHERQAITASTLISRVTLETGQRVDEQIFACASLGDDGRAISTLSSTLKLDPPPTMDRLHLPGAGPERLLARHRERIPSSALAGPPPTEAEVLARYEDHNNREIEFHIGRGAFVAIPEDKLPGDPEGPGLCGRCGDLNDQRRRFLGQDLCPSCIARVSRGKRAASLRTLGFVLAAMVVAGAALLMTQSALTETIARLLGGGAVAELLVDIGFLLIALLVAIVGVAAARRAAKRKPKL